MWGRVGDFQLKVRRTPEGKLQLRIPHQCSDRFGEHSVWRVQKKGHRLQQMWLATCKQDGSSQSRAVSVDGQGSHCHDAATGYGAPAQDGASHSRAVPVIPRISRDPFPSSTPRLPPEEIYRDGIRELTPEPSRIPRGSQSSFKPRAPEPASIPRNSSFEPPAELRGRIQRAGIGRSTSNA